MGYVLLAIVLVVSLGIAGWSAREGVRVARRYTAETGSVAGGRPPWRWGLRWSASLAWGGRTFDAATDGYASANSAWYRRVARGSRPSQGPTG